MEIKTKKAEKEVKKEIKVLKAHQFDNGVITFDMEVNGVTIYCNTLREGKNGQFVSFPSRKGKDDKYYSYAYIKLSEDDTKDIIAQIEKL